ncbi:Lrp/AsnC family transcriptional regulator [Luteithermobacter gelatinilyticus]|uniref:Lrp/AsnC family transcriptional regulator n=1 Tax=Luteithermobacter gelatinilyticus TaxID=2582913 RepID=UPI00143CE983|nr:Lrp/AsnC family transcriptional regulator [Luteithermobacter gelatinilyticus]|tara:strand:+ start:1870 stop:2340 length:471 start_codon:yes stop_codon:yes gene_type:complete
MKKHEIDDVDRLILEHLSRDARMSNREIASHIGVTEGTVRGRIKQLQKAKIIKITAVTSTPDTQNYLMAYMGIRADLNRLKEVAREVADFDFVRFAATMLGRYDILAFVVVSSGRELLDVVNDQVMRVEGVRHVETTLAVHSVKYDYRWGRIVEKS